MQKLVSMPQEALPIQPVLQSCPIQHKTEEEALGNYPGMETPSPLLLHGQGAIALSQVFLFSSVLVASLAAVDM